MTKPPAMPEQFTKKPVTIEAVQFTEALRDAIVLDGAECPKGVKRGSTTWNQKSRKIWLAHFFIDTDSGRMDVELGDWIIKGVKGEFYPCKPDIFELTYDRAALQSAQPAAAEFNGWYCAHCQRGVDATEVTYHEQHTVCGRVITNDAPPVPQPAEVSDAEIRDALEAEFLGEPGKRNLEDDLRVARASLARLRPQADTLCFYLSTMLACPPSDSDVVAAVESLLPLRPQAVPMTPKEVGKAYFVTQDKTDREPTFADGIAAAEEHHGITQRADGREKQA